SVRDALAHAKVEHPDFEAREHPDLLAWSESGPMRPQPPMTSDALHEKIEADPGAAIIELRQYEHETSPFRGPTWNDALDVLADTARRWPETGLSVLDAEDGDLPDIVRSVLRGWAAAHIEDETAGSIVERLDRVDLGS